MTRQKSMHRFFFPFLFSVEKNRFYWYPNHFRRYSTVFDFKWEFWPKTKYRFGIRTINWVEWDVYQVNLTAFIFWPIYKNFSPLTIPEKMRKNESCQINLIDTSFDSVFCSDSESVFSFWPNILFEVENRWIPPKMVRVPVKTVFLDREKERKKNDAYFFA